jgi:DNA-binding protein HU-beta
MPAKSMTQAQIFAKLAEEHELSKIKMKAIFNSFAEMAYKESKKGFTVPGLGKLILVKRKARKARNPLTGESIRVPARKALKFRISKTAKDAVLAKPAEKKNTARKSVKKSAAKKAVKKTVVKKKAAKKTMRKTAGKKK